MLPEDITSLLGHLFACSFLVLSPPGGEEERKGGRGVESVTCVQPCFAFTRKGGVCEMKVGEAVKHPRKGF